MPPQKFLEKKTIITHYELIEKIFCIRSDILCQEEELSQETGK